MFHLMSGTVWEEDSPVFGCGVVIASKCEFTGSSSSDLGVRY